MNSNEKLCSLLALRTLPGGHRWLPPGSEQMEMLSSIQSCMGPRSFGPDRHTHSYSPYLYWVSGILGTWNWKIWGNFGLLTLVENFFVSQLWSSVCEKQESGRAKESWVSLCDKEGVEGQLSSGSPVAQVPANCRVFKNCASYEEAVRMGLY